MRNGSFPPRKLGAYVLAAQLGDDALGTVYRALHAPDEGRLARLRVLQSPELEPERILSAIGRNGASASALSHKTIVLKAELGVADGVPYLAWYEPGGWTLDFLLSKLRAAKARIPIAHALLIVQRVASALEHAWFSLIDAETRGHGVVIPAFVSISQDAEIRLGGFGLAEAVLPVLHKPRLARDVAPYVAPESRATGISGDNSDVFSLGILLAELVTGRREISSPPLSNLSEDPFLDNIRLFLDRALAPSKDRFSSAPDANRALQEILAASPTPVSTSELALFLYDLLNPESRGVSRNLDGESTNPVAAEKHRDRDRDKESAPMFLAEPPDEPVARLTRVPPVNEPKTPQPSESRNPVSLLLYAAAAVCTVFLASWFLSRAGSEPAQPKPASSSAAIPGPAPATKEEAPVESAAAPVPETAPPVFAVRSLSKAAAAPGRRVGKLQRVANPSGNHSTRAGDDGSTARSAADRARLEAGLARVAAERLDASLLAADPFSSGKESEVSAEARLRQGRFSEAEAEFGRAAGLFRNAEELARQERMRRIRLDSSN
jgi:serine/threonine protein kinase